MQKSILDTGPVVALFDSSDNYHKRIYEFFEKSNYKLYLTWPVITEISFLLDFNKETQLDFFKWLERGAIQIVQIDFEDITALRHFINKYNNIPMDLADASLMLISEKLNIKNIITLDSDFHIYRKLNGDYLVNVISGIIK